MVTMVTKAKLVAMATQLLSSWGWGLRNVSVTCSLKYGCDTWTLGKGRPKDKKQNKLGFCDFTGMRYKGDHQQNSFYTQKHWMRQL
jgi:hypothetical protein